MRALGLSALGLLFLSKAAAGQTEEVEAPNPYGASPTPEPTRDPAERPRHEPQSELFEAGAGFQLEGRWFHYTLSPANTKNIRPYDAFPVVMPWVGAQLYPAALTDLSVAKDLGITFSFAKTLGVTSSATQDRTFSTTWNHLTFGLRYRIETGSASMLGLSLAYGSVKVFFEPDDDKALDIAGEVASVHYEHLRLGLDARFDLGAVAIVGGLGYLANLGAGEVYNRFTDANRGTKGDASLGAIDLSGGLSVDITTGVEARFVAEYARYFYSFDPVPGDQYIAGGALDQFLDLRLALFYVY